MKSFDANPSSSSFKASAKQEVVKTSKQRLSDGGDGNKSVRSKIIDEEGEEDVFSVGPRGEGGQMGQDTRVKANVARISSL